ncbi:hypothetical protein V493_04040 [Pseudogymnoascus sp. VKM F-4281 (FW-2241)]|nr:hypothetical protein V493_04040 [Pseudogymnoascus sp. VKM F-4281 (FW-2241)]
MGSVASRQESSQNAKRPARQENPRALKRQRICIDSLDLTKELEESELARKNQSAPEQCEEPTSLAITFGGILDKYGDKHESLIPRRLDGVPVKTRCSLQIYHPTSECQNGTLTVVHEELLRVSQEGDIRTAWNPETGHPETEINLPRSFVIPIRELYVPRNPTAAKSRGASVEALSEISDSEDDSDELLDDGEYGLAEKYFCHVSFSTVRTRPWPPLGLDSEISQGSTIGKQLRHGHSNKRDLKLVSKTELIPLESLSSMKVPLEIKLGPDRQTTQYQLTIDAKWKTPEITQPETEELEMSSKPKCVWKITLGDQEPSESKISDCSCGICLAKFNSIQALTLHLRIDHGHFEFTLTSSTSDKQDFVITMSNRAPKIPPEVNTQIHNDLPVNISPPVNEAPLVDTDAQANKAPEVETVRTIFDFEDDLSSPRSVITTNPFPTPEPHCVEVCSNLEPLPVGDSSTSASVSEPQSKTSSPNTTPDAGSESDGLIESRKRTRGLKSRPTIIVQEGSDSDSDSSSSSLEDVTSKLVVPKTAKPLYDIATKRLLKPGEPLPPSTVSHDWRIRKQADIINNVVDMTPAEKEFVNRWDPFIFGQRSTSKIFMPAILKEFIDLNRRWFDEKQCRKEELLKHLTALAISGRIEGNCLWECLEVFQNEYASPQKVRKARKSSAIAREERSMIQLWDAYVKDSTTKSLEEFHGVSETLRSSRSVHVSEGESVGMLRLFLSYHKRTSKEDTLALDGMFYNSPNLPMPPTEAEYEYVRFFNGFKANFEASEGTDSIKQLMFSFLGENTAWLYEVKQRFQLVRKHLQELHWTKKITLKFRQKVVTYLETIESTPDSDEDMSDAAVVDNLPPVSQTDRRKKGKGKETAAPITPAFAPLLINPDPLNVARPRNVRAFGECECGGYARPGESVMCAAEYCIARTFHRACVPDAPPRGRAWYCHDCAATGLVQATETRLGQMDIST